MSIIKLQHLDLAFGKFYAPDCMEKALFLAALLAASRQGHLCIEIEHQRVLPSFGDELNGLVVKGAHHLEGVSVVDERRWYLKRNFDCEKSFYYHWKRIESQEVIQEIIYKHDELMSREQQNALKQALSHPLAIISGGPGTGKTFTAAKIIELFLQHKNVSIALAAPTGKAASHLKNVLIKSHQGGLEAHTLHSLLRLPDFSKYKLIVVDECSMVDAVMMERLFSSISSGVHLVLLGDVNQLPPIDTGHFFKTLCMSSSAVHLTTGFRTNKQTLIELALKVKNGELIPYKPLPTQKEMIQYLMERLPPHKNYSKELEGEFDNYRCLTALRKGPYGVDQLNQILFRRREALGIKCHPIIIKENSGQKGIVNGDVGLVEGESIWLSSGRKYGVWEVPSYEIAYVMSIHKSQGSEFERVSILLPPGSEEFGRELVYTAITRAKHEATVYSSESVLKETLRQQTVRLSGI